MRSERLERHRLLNGRSSGGERNDGLAPDARGHEAAPGDPFYRPGDQQSSRHDRRDDPPRDVEQPEADGDQADEDDERDEAEE
jgi:hypothetical protein